MLTTAELLFDVLELFELDDVDESAGASRTERDALKLLAGPSLVNGPTLAVGWRF